jgi:cysteine-rich repeat protein
MRFLIVAVLISGCVSSSSVVCDDGRECPAGTVCKQVTNPDQQVCATPNQLSQCDGKAPFDQCQMDGVALARCYDGVCLPAGCGNSRVDPDEVCDDGNTNSGDGCSADCKSIETCGNGVVDPVNGEICDDGNLLDHDGCSSTCQPEQLHWVAHSLTGPTQRVSGMAAYDPSRDRVVIFGGQPDYSGNALIGETWEWTGADWERHVGAAPSIRESAAMAFDGKRVVLFGGQSGAGGTLLDDTWTYDGAGWSPQPVSGPEPRNLHTMAFDSHRGRVVLYGGYAVDGSNPTDTWEWDGASWTAITTSHNPGARAGAMMAYDSVRGRIVLVGGVPPTGTAQTWVYDGTDWTDVTPASGVVPEGFQGAMAFDTALDKMVAFGGCGSLYCVTPSVSRTLAWDGTSWSNLAPAHTPQDRVYTQLASAGERVVLFGGGTSFTTVYGDTWVFETGDWHAPTSPPARSEAMIANDVSHHQLVVFGGVDNAFQPLGDTWLLSTHGWTQVTGGTPPGARYRAAMTFDPVNHNVVMFGGFAGGGLNETWIWNGTAWSQQTVGTPPSARFGAAMAFDGHYVTMFGGGGGDTMTWSWNGTNWAFAAPAHSPTLRLRAAAAYDPIRNELVMFGGLISGNPIDETWTYDGTDWTKKDLAVHPTPRSDATLAWNPARKRLVLSGGSGDVDPWEWDGTQWTPLAAVDAPSARNYFTSATSLAGTGTVIHDGATPTASFDELWELRWDSTHASERCEGDDLDGDKLVGCADPDCWVVCTPACPPGTTCPTGAPKCGDGTCEAAYETCRTCPQDCTCAPLCGDGVCDPGETSTICPGDCH